MLNNHFLLTIVCCCPSNPAQTSVTVSGGVSGTLPCLIAVACERGYLGRHVSMVSKLSGVFFNNI